MTRASDAIARATSARAKGNTYECARVEGRSREARGEKWSPRAVGGARLRGDAPYGTAIKTTRRANGRHCPNELAPAAKYASSSAVDRLPSAALR